MSLKRAAPFSGIAFVVLFIASITVSSVPKDTASDKAWIAAYATHAKQGGHLATGVLLVLAALCLMSFLTHLWRLGRRGRSAPGDPGSSREGQAA